MKNVVSRAAALLAVVTAAWAGSSAAEAQTPRWSGFHIGLNAGAVSANDRLSTQTNDSAAGGFATAQTLGFLPLSRAPNNGFLGGAQAGYSWSFDGIVLGGETDFQFLGASTTVAASPIVAGQQLSTWVTRSQTWLGTTRARAGVTFFPSLLVYATGGLAYGDASLSVNNSSANVVIPVNTTGAQSYTRFGYTVGGGIEYALFAGWSVRAEYLYYDLGVSNVTTQYSFGGGSTATYRVWENGHILRGAVNYRF
jgi:outer membrane immunogenic protein